MFSVSGGEFAKSSPIFLLGKIFVIESIQAFSEGGLYRVEALPPKQGKIYVKDGLTYAEVLKLFESFYHDEKIIGYRDWQKEKNK